MQGNQLQMQHRGCTVLLWFASPTWGVCQSVGSIECSQQSYIPSQLMQINPSRYSIMLYSIWGISQVSTNTIWYVMLSRANAPEQTQLSSLLDFFQGRLELALCIFYLFVFLHFFVFCNFGVWIACMYTEGCFAISEDLSWTLNRAASDAGPN